jgi:hypothetical protein
MKPLALTDELFRVARRCVWYKEPSEAIRQSVHFVAHVLTYGNDDDVRLLRRQLSDDDLREALASAPAGIFDARSWNYWHLVLGNDTVPPLPRRHLGD